MERVSFNSLPIYYEKEKSGIKNNTVRRSLSLWKDKILLKNQRYSLLKKFENKEIKELEIEICLSETDKKESFIRKITDITEYEGFFIITWKHEENNMKVKMDEVNKWYKENKEWLDEMYKEAYPNGTIGHYKDYMRKMYMEITKNQIDYEEEN